MIGFRGRGRVQWRAQGAVESRGAAMKKLAKGAGFAGAQNLIGFSSEGRECSGDAGRLICKQGNCHFCELSPTCIELKSNLSSPAPNSCPLRVKRYSRDGMDGS